MSCRVPSSRAVTALLLVAGALPAQARPTGRSTGTSTGTSTRALDAWFWVAETQLQWQRVRGMPSLALGLEEASSDLPSTVGDEAFAIL